MPASTKLSDSIRQHILYLHSLGISGPKIASIHFRANISRVTVWRVINESEVKHSVSKQAVSDYEATEVSKDTAISRYQPALASSFNGGLGTPSAWQVLQLAIRQVSKNNLSAYDRKAAQMQLRQFVNDKDDDPVLGVLREHLKQRMEQIFGFDGDSDKDRQFGELNELAIFLIKARKQLNNIKLKPRKLVDALLVYVFKDKAKAVIECPEKHLKCPRCRKPRAFTVDKDPRFYLCMSCGKQVEIEKAMIRTTVHKVDQRYLRTVERLLGFLQVPNRTIELAPEVG